jgi:hypothetical protein
MLTRLTQPARGGALYAIDARAPNWFAQGHGGPQGSYLGALTADKSERIDLAAVAQHFEMHMGAGGAPG